MLKLGIVDFDSSHCVEFTKRLNHVGVAKDHWVEGARVVLGCPGESKLSPERVPGFTEQMKKFGVPLVDKPTDMLGKVDVVMIESVDGSVHLERARPFLEAGVPCFVDKPFACSSADARAIVELSAKRKLPLFSSSALRYAPEVVSFASEASHGPVSACTVHGPASLHDRNPGLFHYGIHAVEILYTLMGPGCERVTCVHEKNIDMATGRWKDGRLGSVVGLRGGTSPFGFTAFAAKAVKPVAVSTTVIYRELLKKVVETYSTGKPPIDPAITLEIVAFIEAANKSGHNHGAGEVVKP